MEQSQDKSLHASTFIVAWLQRPPPQSYSPPHQRTIINTLPTSASPRRPPPSYVNIPQKDANGTQHTHLGSNLSHEQRHRRSYATSPTSPCTTQSIIAGHDTRDDRKTRCHRPHPTGRARTSREPLSFPHRRGRRWLPHLRPLCLVAGAAGAAAAPFLQKVAVRLARPWVGGLTAMPSCSAFRRAQPGEIHKHGRWQHGRRRG